MAKAAVRRTSQWTYVLEADRALPVERQTRFTLRPLTFPQRLALLDSFSRVHTASDGSRTVEARKFRSAADIARHGIVSIENFPAGAPKPWPTDAALVDEYLGMFEESDLVEIGNEIWFRSTMDVPETAAGSGAVPTAAG